MSIGTVLRRQKQRLRLAWAFFQDFQLYSKYAALPFQTPNRENLKAMIIVDSHRIEKALSLKHPRPGFGKAVVEGLVAHLNEYETRFGADPLTGIAINVLQGYCDFNTGHGIENPELRTQIESLRQRPGCVQTEDGGVIQINREAVWRDAKVDLQRVFKSRYSVRDFTKEDVDPQLIEQAVAMAQKTPSVCNRQNWKAYVYSETDRKTRLVELQNGNRGFGGAIPKIIIVACDLQGFVPIWERNQAWIDGGMFAMSLVYGLHSLGLGTCCLNLCHDRQTDRRMKAEGRIPDSEVLLMMIAVGQLPETFRVAQSPRKALSDAMIVDPE